LPGNAQGVRPNQTQKPDLKGNIGNRDELVKDLVSAQGLVTHHSGIELNLFLCQLQSEYLPLLSKHESEAYEFCQLTLAKFDLPILLSFDSTQWNRFDPVQQRLPCSASRTDPLILMPLSQNMQHEVAPTEQSLHFWAFYCYILSLHELIKYTF
jgi:hypothetical protein